MNSLRKEMTGGSSGFDAEIWETLEKIIEDNKIPMRDVLESFSIFIRRVNLSKLLIFHDLFKISLDLPGDIVECGIYRGNTLLMLAKMLEIYSPGNRLKNIIGFDNFQGFTCLSEKDGRESTKRSKVIGGWNSGDFKSALYKIIELNDRDSFLPRAPRVRIIEGDICATAPAFVEENPGLRISLLHLNCNLYEPTMAALKNFYPRVVNGGVVILAEYGMMEWAGENAAIDEYFDDNPPNFQRKTWHGQPNCYFIKKENHSCQKP